MRIDILPIGQFEENSYVLHDRGHVLMIDPGRHPALIMKKIDKDETADAVVLTHGHCDHTGAADDIAEAYDCPIFLHPQDWILVQKNPYGRSYEQPIYRPLSELKEGKQTIGSFKVEIIHTPGHTAGSILLRYRDVLFTGDTLFAGDIGRTDLFSGSEEQMIDSLKMIASMSGDLTIYPGHGPQSTLQQENKTNPYLAQYL